MYKFADGPAAAAAVDRHCTAAKSAPQWRPGKTLANSVDRCPRAPPSRPPLTPTTVIRDTPPRAHNRPLRRYRQWPVFYPYSPFRCTFIYSRYYYPLYCIILYLMGTLIIILCNNRVYTLRRNFRCSSYRLPIPNLTSRFPPTARP